MYVNDSGVNAATLQHSSGASSGTSEVESNLELDLYYPTKYLLWYLGKNQLDDNENKENNICKK